MVIFEPKNRLEVTTPKGKGIVWLVTDYGHETDTIYTIILDDSRIVIIKCSCRLFWAHAICYISIVIG
jgi:hypothetical protein